MNTILVVTQCWQDYGDGGATPILATFDLKKAEAKVKEMEGRQEARALVYDMIQEHMGEWEKADPRPRMTIENIKDEQQAALFSVWVHARYEELTRFTSTFTEAEQADQRDLNADLFWEIETVAFEE